MTRSALLIATLVLAVFAPAPATAFVAPLTMDDDFAYARPVEGLQAIAVSIAIEQPAAAREPWEVDVELWLRNGRPLDVSLELAALLDDATVYLDGAPISARDLHVSHDPASPEHSYGDAAGFSVAFAAEQVRSVRVVGTVAPVVDTVGQVFVELPTHALGLYEGAIHGGTMHASLRDRPFAVQSTIGGYTTFDEPENRLSWQLREWAPRMPFRLSYLPSWSALQLMAEVEQCPAPWPVVRAMSDGDMATVRGLLATLDEGTLGFCANLPLVVHGFAFESERARQQLREVPMSRYLTGRQVEGPAYVENAAYREGDLSDAERIYRSTLRQFAEQRAAEAELEGFAE